MKIQRNHVYCGFGVFSAKDIPFFDDDPAVTFSIFLLKRYCWSFLFLTNFSVSSIKVLSCLILLSKMSGKITDSFRTKASFAGMSIFSDLEQIHKTFGYF